MRTEHSLKPKPYLRGRGKRLGEYNPHLRDKLVIVHPKTKEEYVVRGLVIVDSGASGLSLQIGEFERMAKKLKLGRFDIGGKMFQTAAGPIIAPVAKKLAYCVKKSCIKAEISGNPGRDTLLGMDFLVASKCTFDFKKKVVRCGSDELKVGPRFGIFGKTKR